MNHYVYEITNNINGKKYIGKRTCKCPIEEDKYMGSGYLLKKAIKKHGIENFTKKILFIAESEEEAYQKEFDVIESVQAYKNPNYYNIQRGGLGGWKGLLSGTNNPMYGKTHSSEVRQFLSKINKGRFIGKKSPMFGKCLSEETKRKISNSKIGKYTGNLNPNYGKHLSEESKNKIRIANIGNKHRLGKCHSEEAKQKMSRNRKGKTIGENHPMYGKHLSLETKIKIGNANRGRRHTEESKKKISNAMSGKNNPMYDKKGELNPNYGKKHSKEHTDKIAIKKRKKVICLNNLVVFGSIKEASESIGVSHGHISNCCKGKRKSAGKINGQPAKWMYYDEYLAKEV